MQRLLCLIHEDFIKEGSNLTLIVRPDLSEQVPESFFFGMCISLTNLSSSCIGLSTVWQEKLIKSGLSHSMTFFNHVRYQKVITFSMC